MATKKTGALTFFVGGCEDFKDEINGAGTGGQIGNHSFLGTSMKEVKETLIENSLDLLNLEEGNIVYEVTVRPIGKINIGITPIKNKRS